MPINLPALWAYYVGIIFGGLILTSVVFVYIKTKKLSPGGVALSLVGLSLVGLSIWKNMNLDFKTGTLKVELRDALAKNSSVEAVSPNLGPSVESPLRYKIAVVNKSTTIADAEIRPVVAALRKQVSKDLAPIWGVSADITFIGKRERPPPDMWPLEILDQDVGSTGALGYHDVNADGLPIGKVFVEQAKRFDVPWSLTASHEVLNMLVNPSINLTVFITSGSSGGTIYAYEIASPCQLKTYGYKIDGILVSDFVYPTWFEPRGVKPGIRLDHTKHAHKPLKVCPGGYILVYKVKSGKWDQIVN